MEGIWKRPPNNALDQLFAWWRALSRYSVVHPWPSTGPTNVKLVPMKYLARITSLTGPTTGWEPGDRLRAEVQDPSDPRKPMLLGEFRSYGDADRAIRSWQAEHHGPESCDGQGVSYVVPDARDFENPRFNPRVEGVPSVLGARSPRRHPDGALPQLGAPALRDPRPSGP